MTPRNKINDAIIDIVRNEIQKSHMASKAWVEANIMSSERSCNHQFINWGKRISSLEKQTRKLFAIMDKQNKDVDVKTSEPLHTTDPSRNIYSVHFRGSRGDNIEYHPANNIHEIVHALDGYELLSVNLWKEGKPCE